MSGRDSGLVWKPAPLLPPDRAQDVALVVVTAILCFFACLAVLGALGADRAAKGWRGQLVGSATAIVRASATESADAAAARAAETLAGLRGVSEAKTMEKARAYALIQPWLGPQAALDDLPVPRLIEIELDRKAPARAADLDKALREAGIDATVDDHSQWTREIIRAGEQARLAAVIAALLMAVAAAAVVVLATRAGLAARREVIEVLHLAGARDEFVAGLFQARFARLAALGGLLGSAAAAMIGAVVRLAGGGHGLTPVLPIGWSDLVAIAPCAVIAALIAAVAARIATLGLVGEMT